MAARLQLLATLAGHPANPVRAVRLAADRAKAPWIAQSHERIALDITAVLSRSLDRHLERDATQETGHEIRHLL